MDVGGDDSCVTSGMRNNLEEPPSLLYISVISVITKLWAAHDIVSNMEQTVHENSTENFKHLLDYFDAWEIIVREKLANIVIPVFLKTEISKYIKPIGIELFRYIYRTKYDSIVWSTKRGDTIRWTMDGIIDRVETAKELLQNRVQNQEHFSLFKLACYYCFDDYIAELWKKFGHLYDFQFNPKCTIVEFLVFYWISFHKKEMPKLIRSIKDNESTYLYDESRSVCANMLKYGIIGRSVSAVKYFWRKLSQEEKSSNLKEWLMMVLDRYGFLDTTSFCTYQPDNEIICYFLTQLHDTNQMNEICQLYWFKLLRFLCCRRPLQQSAMSIISSYILKYTKFNEIIYFASDLIAENISGEEIFRQLWLLAPLSQRKEYLHLEKYSLKTINNLLKNGFIDSAELMLSDLSSASSKSFKEKKINRIAIYRNLIESGKYEVIDQFLHWYFTTKKEKQQFKKEFVSESNLMQWQKLLVNISGARKFALKSFEKFINFTSLSPEEVSRTKRLFLDFVECILVKYFNMDFATILLNWCLSSAHDIKRFKNELMVSNKGIDILFDSLCRCTSCRTAKRLERTIEFFRPFSSEVYEKVRTSLYEKVLSFREQYKFDDATREAFHLFDSYAIKSIDEPVLTISVI